jgi:hypothetical protein
MPELALDQWERDAFVQELDGVSVPQLVRREAPAHPGLGRGSVQSSRAADSDQ